MIKAVIFDFFGVLEVQGTLNQELFSYIPHLREAGIKIGMISNASEDWAGSLLSEQQRLLFDDLVISYQAKLAKPDPEIYQLALRNLAAEPEQAIFVDDIEHFCRAAKTVGMKAVCYKNFEQMKQDVERILAGAGADN